MFERFHYFMLQLLTDFAQQISAQINVIIPKERYIFH